MEAALKVMFRLDLAREMRILSADELHLYDDMKSLLPRLEAEIGEVATAPSIALEDPSTCQLHAPSVALAGANEVPSPLVPSASTSVKLSADLQLAERSQDQKLRLQLSSHLQCQNQPSRTMKSLKLFTVTVSVVAGSQFSGISARNESVSQPHHSQRPLMDAFGFSRGPHII
jgi:hypothetical protein